MARKVATHAAASGRRSCCCCLQFGMQWQGLRCNAAPGKGLPGLPPPARTSCPPAAAVGLAEYTLHNIIVHCEEDANISLAAELLEGRFSSSAAPGSAGAAEGAAAGSGSSGSGWVIGVVVAFVSAVAVALAGVALLLWHRRRAARRTAAKPAAARGDAARPSALHAAQPQRSTHLTRMESGEVLGPATLAPQAETDRAVAGVPHSSSHNSDDTWPEEALWRSRWAGRCCERSAAAVAPRCLSAFHPSCCPWLFHHVKPFPPPAAALA